MVSVDTVITNNIERAYADWNPSFFKPMTITAGKMKNPFHTQYSNDVLFDPEI